MDQGVHDRFADAILAVIQQFAQCDGKGAMLIGFAVGQMNKDGATPQAMRKLLNEMIRELQTDQS